MAGSACRNCQHPQRADDGPFQRDDGRNQRQKCHIARWREGADALAAGVEFVRRSYTMADSELPPDQFRVFKFGHMQSGTVRNAVSAYTVLEGTLRTFQDEVFDHITRRAAEIGQDVQKETGCQISVRFSQGYPPVYNDPALYEQAAALLAPDRLVPLKEPALIAEDFSFYQQELPGLFFFLGTGSDQPLHSDRFCFDESVLEQGVALYQTLLQL